MESKDLIVFLADECEGYKKLLSDYEESGDLQALHEDKDEFLDNVWNIVYRYFTGERNGGFLPGPE